MPRRVPARLGALAFAVVTAAALAACGDSATSSSSVPAPAASSCATSAASCPVAGPTPPPATSAAGQGCTSAGSGRTDDFHQPVTLTTLPDGLQVGDIKVGAGPAVQQGQSLMVAYSGWLQNGTLFDSSRKPGGQPFPLVLGAHQAIAGFEEALTTMHVGGIRRAVIPPQLGYGAQANGPIPANSTLTFDLEVLCAA